MLPSYSRLGRLKGSAWHQLPSLKNFKVGGRKMRTRWIYSVLTLGKKIPGSFCLPPCATPHCVCPFFACRKASEWCSRFKVSLDKDLNFWVWTPGSELQTSGVFQSPAHQYTRWKKTQAFPLSEKCPAKLFAVLSSGRMGMEFQEQSGGELAKNTLKLTM